MQREIGATRSSRSLVAFVFVLALTGLAAGCVSFNPGPSGQSEFMQRAQTQSDTGVAVTVAVPSAGEAAAIFDVPVDRKGIQPVWVRIENRDEIDYISVQAAMDADYFSPQEAAWKLRSGFSSQGKSDMQLYFNEQSMRLYVAAGKTVEGYVHTNQDYGVKYLSVVLYHPGHTKTFEFVVEVPGIQADYTQFLYAIRFRRGGTAAQQT